MWCGFRRNAHINPWGEKSSSRVGILNLVYVGYSCSWYSKDSTEICHFSLPEQDGVSWRRLWELVSRSLAICWNPDQSWMDYRLFMRISLVSYKCRCLPPPQWRFIFPPLQPRPRLFDKFFTKIHSESHETAGECGRDLGVLLLLQQGRGDWEVRDWLVQWISVLGGRQARGSAVSVRYLYQGELI